MLVTACLRSNNVSRKNSRLKAELEASQSRAAWAEKELDTKVNELREERRRAINLQVGRHNLQ